jgi:hypothetical protein
MTANRPSLAKLKSNPAWASLPLFDRKGWKRVRFGDVMENCAETCEPAQRIPRPPLRATTAFT